MLRESSERQADEGKQRIRARMRVLGWRCIRDTLYFILYVLQECSKCFPGDKEERASRISLGQNISKCRDVTNP